MVTFSNHYQADTNEKVDKKQENLINFDLILISNRFKVKHISWTRTEKKYYACGIDKKNKKFILQIYFLCEKKRLKESPRESFRFESKTSIELYIV